MEGRVRVLVELGIRVYIHGWKFILARIGFE